MQFVEKIFYFCTFKKGYILLSAHREENIDTEKNFLSLFNAINKMAEKYDMPILYSCHPRSKKRLKESGFKLDSTVSYTHLTLPTTSRV